MRSKHFTPFIVLLFLTLIETLCCTYFLEYRGLTKLNTIVYMLSGLSIGIIPLFIVKSIKVLPDKSTFIQANKMLLWGFFIFIVVYFIYHSHDIIKSMAIDYHVADMLPQIKAMCQRLFKGETVYAPIKEIWNGKHPPYLPLMWLPFAPAEYFGFDVRWAAVLAILTGLLLVFLILPNRLTRNPLLLASVLFSLFLLINYLLIKDRYTIGVSEEGLIVGYYLFLGFSLSKKNPYLIGLAIACCLMSRFALFFWVPMFIIYVYFFESKKNAFIIFSIISIIVLLVFLIPFGFRQPEYFLNIPADYHVGVDRAWNWYPDKIHYGMGLAKFFDITQTKLIHNLQISISAIIPVLFIVTFVLLRKRFNLNATFFGLCSLKVSLVFFYIFLEVPYFYLYFVPTFFSYTILFKSLAQINPSTKAIS